MKNKNLSLKISLDHEPIMEVKNKSMAELKDVFKRLERKFK